MTDPGPTGGRRHVRRAVQLILSVVIVAGIFSFAIPKVADYSEVWSAIAAMTWMELTSLVLAMVFNLVTYWWQNMASIPGLGLLQAAVNNQSSTSIADTIPGGGYVAVGVSYAMYRSWGFASSTIAISVAVTGIWNIYLKLGLPVVAFALLAIQGRASAGLATASLVGVAFLAASIVLFALALWKEALARSIGGGVGKALALVRRLVRRPPSQGWGDAAVRFRRQTIDLVARRWPALTVTTLLSHLALWFVLLLSVRHVGISSQEIGTVEVLGVFAIGRLVTALPLTPGGLGVVELSYIGGLILAGRGRADVPPDVFRAQVTAAVLVFRALTYGVQVPLGGITYLIWRSNKGWRRSPPDEPAPPVAQRPMAE